MEAFLHRLAYLESVGQTSGDARIRGCREVGAVHTGIRAMGLTGAGGLAAGRGEDFVIGQVDVPAEPEPENRTGIAAGDQQPGCAHTWMELTSPEMRAAAELASSVWDTGPVPDTCMRG